MAEERRGIPGRQGWRDGWGLLLYGRACRRVGGSANHRGAISNAYQASVHFSWKVGLLKGNGVWPAHRLQVEATCAWRRCRKACRGVHGCTDGLLLPRGRRCQIQNSNIKPKEGIYSVSVCGWRSGADATGAGTPAVVPVRLCSSPHRERFRCTAARTRQASDPDG